MPDPTDRIRTERRITAMAALDTMDAIAERVTNLLSHGRRITITRRYTYVDQPPEVTAGLTVDEVKTWSNATGAGIGVHLKPGILKNFGFAAYAGENDTEKQEWARFHAAESISDQWSKRRRDMTKVTITGGLTGDGPARDDQLVIRAWNRDGVCDEYVIAFDYGPDTADRERLARHLYEQATNGQDDQPSWDRYEETVYRRWMDEAGRVLAILNGKEG